jgi:hypothetical protein
MRVIKLRTYAEAVKASPWIQSILSSIRQHWLDLKINTRRLEIMAKRPGRLNRAELIEQEEIKKKAEQAESDFTDAVQELMGMDFFLLDPTAGMALIPFNMSNTLAWFIYQWTERKIVGWRFHQDDLNTVHELQAAINDPYANPPVT